MSKEMGMKALRLEMTDRVYRMEYSVLGHSKLIEKVTGISVADQKSGRWMDAYNSFCKAWDICMQWSIMVNNSFLGRYCTSMGHATYSEGGTEFNTNVNKLFEDEEDVF
ncbi:MAG: hypothetical protein IJY04_10370, partial [Clostridia bacterium]|nr:hypothetical protein [Clostridia bacterium]